MLKKAEGWKVGGLAKNLKGEGFKDSRIQGFKDSSEKGRRLEGWKVGGLAN